MSGPKRVVVAGDDEHGLGDALAAGEATVSRVDGVLTAERLADAGADDADVYVLTDIAEATSIPVVAERNPDARIVVYADDSLPEFVRGVADLAVDPALVDASVVAEELLHDGDDAA
jgi:hypothetical protein